MSYYITIKNELLEAKHVNAMGAAVWLFMLFLDKVMAINENGIGKVLNGRPVVFEEHVQPVLGISGRTYRRWIATLRETGYIRTLQAPYGLIIYVNKAEKMWGQKAKNKNAELFTENRPAKYGTSKKLKNKERPAKYGRRDRPNMADPPAKYGTSNKDNSINNSINNSNVELQKLIRLIYDHFIKQFSKNPKQYKLSKQRKLKIKARLNDAGEELLLAAISNTAKSSFHRGDNDRGWQADLDFIIRSYEQVEKLANMGNDSADEKYQEALKRRV